MTTLEDFRDEIVNTVPDSSFSDDWIDAQINKCISICARLVRLPALETSNTVSTVVGTPFVDIPAGWNYHHGLYAASVEGASEITVKGSRSLLHRHYPGAELELETGDIEYLTVVGSQLFYYPIPTVITTINCSFYEEPTTLTNDTDNLTCIPEELQEDLILPFVKWRMYKKREDGAEGGMANTKHYKKEFYEAIALLDEVFDFGQSYPEVDRTTGWV